MRHDHQGSAKEAPLWATPGECCSRPCCRKSATALRYQPPSSAAKKGTGQSGVTPLRRVCTREGRYSTKGQPAGDSSSSGGGDLLCTHADCRLLWAQPRPAQWRPAPHLQPRVPLPAAAAAPLPWPRAAAPPPPPPQPPPAGQPTLQGSCPAAPAPAPPAGCPAAWAPRPPRPCRVAADTEGAKVGQANPGAQISSWARLFARRCACMHAGS